MNYFRRTTPIALIIAFLLAACGSAATPVPTPAPTATPLPGFRLYEGNGVALQLPDSFDGGRISSEDFKLVLERLKGLGAEFENIAKAVESNPDLYLLWAFDSKVGPSGFLTNANVTSEQVMSAVSVEVYAAAVRKQLPAQIEIQSQDNLTVAGQPAVRLISVMEQFNAKQSMYLLKQGNRIYSVTYSTGIDEFEQRLKQFEQSIQTFTVTP